MASYTTATGRASNIFRPESAGSDDYLLDNDINSLVSKKIILSAPTPSSFEYQRARTLSLRTKDHKPPIHAASAAPRRLSRDHQTTISDFLPNNHDFLFANLAYDSQDYNPFQSPLPTCSSTYITVDKPKPSRPSSSVGAACQYSHSSARRRSPLQVRGVINSAGEDSKRWLEAMQLILQYHFHNHDLLEEALESPGSGVTCVGVSHRHLGSEGNAGLAGVGKGAMELVLRDQCYLRKIGEKEAVRIIGRVLGWRNLLPLGERSKLERFVRTKRSARKSHSQILKMLKEDVKTEDSSRAVARAVKAVIGAVYYDGGIDNVIKVMGTLKIKIPEK